MAVTQAHRRLLRCFPVACPPDGLQVPPPHTPFRLLAFAPASTAVFTFREQPLRSSAPACSWLVYHLEPSRALGRLPAASPTSHTLLPWGSRAHSDCSVFFLSGS